MIDLGDIEELLNKEPFKPFRIRMADGNSYSVTNPNLVVPMESQLFIALPKDRWKRCAHAGEATAPCGRKSCRAG